MPKLEGYVDMVSIITKALASCIEKGIMILGSASDCIKKSRFFHIYVHTETKYWKNCSYGLGMGQAGRIKKKVTSRSLV